MSGGISGPLAGYQNGLREKFSKLAAEKFLELAERSGVDVEANRRLVAETDALESQASSARNRKILLGLLAAAGFVCAAVCAVKAHGGAEPLWPWIAGAAAGAAAGIAAIPFFRNVSKRLDDLRGRIAENKKTGWRQMEPLNRLYDWDIPASLMEKAMPGIVFDPYFTERRFLSLGGLSGLDGSSDETKSTLSTLTGVLNGSPFAFVRNLEMEWEEETYEGTKEISWTELEEGPDGKTRRVRKYETLHAYVTKPVPAYYERTVLVYGNDGAPDLSFSRVPSGFTGKDGNLWSAIRKKWRLNRLDAYSRNLDDDSNFTLMGNKEFETWFHAKDRDDEVQFRLMFTPVAQVQMMSLMKDSAIGFGDDFAFIKRKKTNIIVPEHLRDAALGTDPATFRSWNFDAAKAFFSDFNERYFKNIYFTLAPLLCIPLYQETEFKTLEEGGAGARDIPCRRECEAAANYCGGKRFKPEGCITRCLLKTVRVPSGAGEDIIEVTAHGYRGEERVEWKEATGGDGKRHSIAVPWTEYLPVEKTSALRCMRRNAAGGREETGAQPPPGGRIFRDFILGG